MTQSTRRLNQSHLFAEAADNWALSRGILISGSMSQPLRTSNNLLDLADVPTARINLGLRIGIDVQAHSSVLDRYTISSPSNLALSLLTLESTAEWRSALQTSTNAGTVSSVMVSGGSTGLTVSGGPITSTGTLTLGGTLSVASGGTGVTTLNSLSTALDAVGGDPTARTMAMRGAVYLPFAGIVFDGVTDQSAKLTTLFAAGGIFLIPKTALPLVVNSPVTIPSGTKIIGTKGAKVLTSVATLGVFDLNGADDCEVSGITFAANYIKTYYAGTFRNDNVYSALCAIYVGGSRNKVSDCSFDSHVSGVILSAWDPSINGETSTHYDNIVERCGFTNVDFGVIYKGQNGAIVRDIVGRDITLSSGSPNPQHTVYGTGGTNRRNANVTIDNVRTINCTQSAAVQVKFQDGGSVSNLYSHNAASFNGISLIGVSIFNVTATEAHAQAGPSGAFGLVTQSGDSTTRSNNCEVVGINISMAADELQAGQFYCDQTTVKATKFTMNRSVNVGNTDFSLVGTRNNLDVDVINNGAGSGVQCTIKFVSGVSTSTNYIRLRANNTRNMFKIESGVSNTSLSYNPAQTTNTGGAAFISDAGGSNTRIIRDETEVALSALSGGSATNANSMRATWATRYVIPIADTAPYTIPDILESTSSNTPIGTTLTLVIFNTSVSSLGAISWASGYRINHFAPPTAGGSAVLNLRFDGTKWVQQITDGFDAVSMLTDVDLTTPQTSGQALTWNTTTNKWVPTTVPIAALDTDTALVSNSDTKVPSQKAIKNYIDTSVTAVKTGLLSLDRFNVPSNGSEVSAQIQSAIIAAKSAGASGLFIPSTDAGYGVDAGATIFVPTGFLLQGVKGRSLIKSLGTSFASAPTFPYIAQAMFAVGDPATGGRYGTETGRRTIGSGATFNVTVSGGVATAVSLASGGSGYRIGDKISLINNTIIFVTGLSGSAVSSYVLWSGGSGWGTPSNPYSQTHTTGIMLSDRIFDTPSFADQVHFRDIVLDGGYGYTDTYGNINSILTGTQGRRGIEARGVLNFSLSGVQFHRFADCGYYGFDIKNAHIWDNYANDCGWGGRFGACRNGTFHNALFSVNQPELNSEYTSFHHNVMRKIADVGSQFSNVENFDIHHNHFLGCGTIGIEGESSTFANWQTYAGNGGIQPPGSGSITDNIVNGLMLDGTLATNTTSSFNPVSPYAYKGISWGTGNEGTIVEGRNQIKHMAGNGLMIIINSGGLIEGVGGTKVINTCQSSNPAASPAPITNGVPASSTVAIPSISGGLQAVYLLASRVRWRRNEIGSRRLGVGLYVTSNGFPTEYDLSDNRVDGALADTSKASIQLYFVRSSTVLKVDFSGCSGENHQIEFIRFSVEITAALTVRHFRADRLNVVNANRANIAGTAVVLVTTTGSAVLNPTTVSVDGLQYMESSISSNTTVPVKINYNNSTATSSISISDMIAPQFTTKTNISGISIAPTTVRIDNDIDVDGTLSSNSDVKIPSQKAVKAYVDGSLNSPKITSLGKLSRGLGSQGGVIFGGRCASTRAVESYSTEIIYELPCAADELFFVQVITATAAPSSGATTGIFASVMPIGAITDLDANNFSTAATVNWLAAGGVRLIGGATTSRRAYQISDPTPITPVSRTDGGTRALIAARAYYGVGSYNFLGNNGVSDIYNNWASRSAGKVRLRRNTVVGDQRSSANNWVVEQFSPIIGFAYSTHRPHVQVATFGDSISSGRGTYIEASQNLLACEALNGAQSKIIFAHLNLSWSGQTMSNIYKNMSDAFRAGIIPDVAIFPCGSPNDIGNRAITDADILSIRGYFDGMLGLCAQYGVAPLVWTWMPTNSVVNNYGTSDSKRVVYNTDIVARCASYGISCIDLATIISGVTTGGQIQMLAGATSDNIHPNDTGITLLYPYVQTGLQSLCGGFL